MTTPVATGFVRIRRLEDGELRESVAADLKGIGKDATATSAVVSSSMGGAAKKVGSSFATESSRASSSLRGLAKAGAAVAAGFLATKGASFVKQAVTDASDLNEQTSKLNVVLGKRGAAAAQEFARSASQAFGQSRLQALEATATFGTMGKAAGLSGKGLAKFSTDFTRLSSDLASFNNATPEQAIEAIGAALRGESEPIRAFGVLLNDASLKAEALALGLSKPIRDQSKIETYRVRAIEGQRKLNEAIAEFGKESLEADKAAAALGAAQRGLDKATAGTVEPLTQQQKVLAAQSLIYKQTADAQGDFARTGDGLANRQRTLKAGFRDLSTAIGTGFLPAVNGATGLLVRMLPPAQRLAERVAPKLGAALGSMFDGFDTAGADGLVKSLEGVNFGKMGAGASELAGALGALGKELGKASGELAGDTFRVAGVAIKFAAANVDLLAKALPALAAGFVAYKVAQAAANTAALLAVPLKIAEIVAIRAHTSALIGNTAAANAATVASNAGFLARARERIAILASAAAQGVCAVATRGWALAQRALNLSLLASPIGLTAVAIGGLVAGLVIAYRKSETFRKIVSGAFSKVWGVIKSVFGWVKKNWPTLLAVLTGPIGLAVLAIARNWSKIKAGAANVKSFITDKFSALVGFFRSMPSKMAGSLGKIWDALGEGFRDVINKIIGWWNNFQLKLDIPDKIPGLPDSFTINTPNISRLASGGRVTTDGRVVHVAEGGEPESVLPDSMLRGLLERTAERARSGRDRLRELAGRAVEIHQHFPSDGGAEAAGRRALDALAAAGL